MGELFICLVLAVTALRCLVGLARVAVSGVYSGCAVLPSHCSGLSGCGARVLAHTGLAVSGL